MRLGERAETLWVGNRLVADEGKDALRPFLAAQLDGIDLEEREGARLWRRALAGDDRHAVGLRRFLEARGDVDHVAEDRIVEALRRADIADAAGAGVEADADAHDGRRLAARGRLRRPVLVHAL